MNTKRTVFWLCFAVILGLIIWGLVVAVNKPVPGQGLSAAPAPVNAADHIEGPATAKVTLIEYGDFQCPACGAFAPIVEKLFAESSSTLRVVFRHFPLPQHQNAPIAARASEAAGDQGKFWDMYAKLYDGQDLWSTDSDADARAAFAGYAKELGLDAAKFAQDIDSTTTIQTVAADQAEGQNIGISYTPTFIVNGKLITNPEGYAAFKALIDAAAK